MRNKKIFLLILIFAGTALTVFFLFKNSSSQPTNLSVNANNLGPSPKVATTVWPVYVLTRPVVEGEADIISLTGNNVDPHNFAPSVDNIKQLADADFLVVNGGGLEPWLQNFLQAVNNPKLKVIDLSQGLTAVQSSRYLFDVTDQAACQRRDGAWQACGPNDCQLQGGQVCPQVCGKPICVFLEKDPHFWLDPILASQQVKNMGQQLSQATNDPIYASQADKYSADLTALSGQVSDSLKDYAGGEFISEHPAFTYFAQRFKLSQLATFEITPGQEPTPKDLENIAKLVKDHGIKSVFVEPGPVSPVIKNFADEFNLKILVLDPMETGTYSPDAYEKATLQNVTAFKQAFDLIKK